MTILLGFLLALIISAAAYWKKSLNRSGALAALLMGTIIFGLGGLPWAILLLFFFFSSSALSRWKKARKLQFEEKFSKTSRRDAAQVLANGGLAMLLVICQRIIPETNWIWLAFAASLAAANADTWATELGVLSKRSPRMIHNGQIVEPGTSGGISPAGIWASICGSALIALPAVLLWQGNLPPAGLLAGILVFLLLTLAGLGASLTDSWLGATVQAIYACPHCQKETERHPLHACQTPTHLIRGWSWLNNDWVNFAATVSGMLTALLLAAVLSLSSLFSLSGHGSTQRFVLQSPALAYGAAIPDRYTCQGENLALEFTWRNLPAETSAVLIIMQDSDTPFGRITHWLASAPVDVQSQSSTQQVTWVGGKNFASNLGYAGPCPPLDPPHRYHVRVFALRKPLNLPQGFSWKSALQAMRGQVLAESSWMGRYP